MCRQRQVHLQFAAPGRREIALAVAAGVLGRALAQGAPLPG